MNNFARNSTIALSLFLAMALNLSAQTAQQNSPTLKRRPPRQLMEPKDVPGAGSALAFLQDSPAILPPPMQLTVNAGVPLR
ncbi:MAG: hypothetical protein ACRETL_11100, partial [Gammaproteobacteria bacterium]